MYIEELSELSGSDIIELKGNHYYTLYDNRIMVLLGHKGIYSIADDQVVVKCHKYRLAVRGSSLKIKAINDVEIVIVGDIDSIEKI